MAQGICAPLCTYSSLVKSFEVYWVNFGEEFFFVISKSWKNILG